MVNKIPKILIFGFEPYKKYKENITKKIVKEFKFTRGLARIVFPVRFDKVMFLRAIEKHKPDIILGLGQHPRARKIHIERKAVNLKNENSRIKMIESGAEKYRFVNWMIAKDENCLISYNAGDYVCNFCMYVIMGFIKNRNTKFAFLHIPKDYNTIRAINLIKAKINRI